MENQENRKEELYSQAIPAGKRRYFFDVKETRGGDKFITITESRKLFNNNTGDFYFEKNKMFLYKEDFEKFKNALSGVIDFIEFGEEPAEEFFDSESFGKESGSDEINDISFDDIDLAL